MAAANVSAAINFRMFAPPLFQHCKSCAQVAQKTLRANAISARKQCIPTVTTRSVLSKVAAQILIEIYLIVLLETPLIMQ